MELRKLRIGLLRVLAGDTDSLKDMIGKDLIFQYSRSTNTSQSMELGRQLQEMERPYRTLIALVERKLASRPQSLVGFATDLLYACFG